MRNNMDLGPIYNTNKSAERKPLNIDNPIYTNPIAIQKNTNKNAYQFNHLKTLGLYIQDSAYFTDDFIITGGLRYEYFDQVIGRSTLDNIRSGYLAQTDGKLLYQFGSVYKFTPRIATFFNCAESFRPQNNRTLIINSELPAEQGKSFETGLKYDNSYLNATLALFNINKSNVAEIVNINNTNELQIVGKQRSRGIEFDINGQLTDNLSIAVNYTYIKVKTLENHNNKLAIGKQLSSVPKHQSSLFLAYNIGEFDFGHIRVGGAHYLGSWYAYNSTYTKAYKLPHSVVYDAFIAYDTKISGKKLSFQLNGKNLSNKVYYPSTSGNANGTLIPVALGYAREVILNTKIEF